MVAVSTPTKNISYVNVTFMDMSLRCDTRHNMQPTYEILNFISFTFNAIIKHARKGTASYYYGLVGITLCEKK